MADEKERVEYSFTGDVSSLKKATQEAINLLGKYGDAMANASKQGSFNASQRSEKSFNASINRMIKDVEKLQAKLKGVGDVKLPTGSASNKAMSATLQQLTEQLTKLGSADKVTTASLTRIRDGIKAASASMQSAVPQIDKLITSEQRFQTVLGTVQAKADKFRTSMDNMKTRMNGVFEPVTAKLRSFSGVFDNIGAKMQSFKDRAATAFSRVSQLAGACASAFRRTSQEADKGDASAARSAKAHKTLGDVLSSIASKFKGETKAVSDEDSKLKSKNRTLKTSHSSHSKLLQVLTSLGTKFKSEVKNIQNFTQNLTKLNGASGLLKKGFQALTGVAVGDWLASAAKEAINYIENLNLFTVAMGSSIDKGMEFVSKMQEVYGMDPSNLYRYAGYFYQLTDAIGMADDASATLSLSMTKAANDIASLFNMDIETVVDNLASGMQGMSRAVRKYGMDIRATTLQTTAYKYGLTEQVETMSEANRMALRYLTMMDQARNATQQVETSTDGATSAMGDFARNIETPANQLRIFKEQMAQLGRAIGNFIVKPFATAIAYINGFIMALRTVLNFIAGLFGLLQTNTSAVTAGADAMDTEADAIGGVGGAAADAKKELDKLTAPFDELNVLAEEAADAGGGGGGAAFDDLLDPALAEAIANMELKLEDIRMKANEVRDAILEALGFTYNADGEIIWSKDLFRESLIKMFPQWEDTINEAFENWDLSSIGQILAVVVSGVASKFADWVSWDNLGPSITKFMDGFTQIFNAYVQTADGAEIGRAMGEVVNTAFHSVYELVSRLDWASLGVYMGSKINGALQAIDWNVAGATFSTGVLGMLTTLNNLILTTDWSFIGTSIGTMLASFDWAQNISLFIVAATNLLVSLVNAIVAALPGVAESLAAVAQGLADGIVQAAPLILPAAGSLLTALVQGITDSLPTIVQSGLDIIMAWGQAILDYIPTFLTVVPQLINQLVTTIINCIPQIIQTGVQLISALVTDLPTIIQNLVTALLSILDNLVQAIITNLPMIVEAGVQLFVSLITNLPQIIATNVQAIPQIITGITNAITELIPAIIVAGVQLLTSLIENLPEIIVKIVSAVPQIIAGIVEAFGSLIGSIIDIGKSLLEGIWQGIQNAASWLWDKVTGFFGGIVDGIKNFLGIHSPSTVMADIGDNMTAGLSQGIEDNSDAPAAAVAQMLNDMTAATTTSQGSFATFVTNVTNNMLSGFRNMYAVMVPEFQNFLNNLHAQLTTYQNTTLAELTTFLTTCTTQLNTFGTQTKAWSTDLTNVIKTMFKNMWATILADTTTFQNTLQQKLDSMVAAARAAAAAIASALSSAQSSAKAMSSLSTSATAKVSTRVKKMATGGVVTGPTRAIVGEGRYSEAVIPLEDSPQMQDLIDKIADAVDKTDGGGGGQPVDVHVYIGGKEYDAFTYKSSERGKKVVGKQPIKTGG